MGCGGGKSAAVDAPTKEAVENVQPEEEQVWATKTEAAKRPQPQTSVQALNSGPQASNKGNAWSVEDADDEIEIVDEGNKQQPRDKANMVSKIGGDQFEASNVANAQEAPQSEMLLDIDGSGGGAAAKPLPKQQAEEAAKLAEQRKRFDNQRYQNSTLSPVRAAPTPTASVPRGANPAPTSDVAAVPLSLTNHVSTPNKESKLGAFLPGGVLDDLEEFDLAGPEQDIKLMDDDFNDVAGAGKQSNGFDEADEALMKEILEDFDDV